MPNLVAVRRLCRKKRGAKPDDSHRHLGCENASGHASGPLVCVSVCTQRGSRPRLCTVPSLSMAASFVGMEEWVGSCQRHVVSLSQSSFADTYLWIHGILIFWPHHLSSSSGLLSYGIAKKENQLCSWSFAGV